MSSLYNHVNIVDTLQTEHYINQFNFFPLNLFPDAKRLIGRKFDDLVVQSDMKHWPFKVINESSKPKVEVEYKGEIKTFYAEEISSMVLTKMKEISEAYLGKVDKSEWITESLKLGFMQEKNPATISKLNWLIFVNMNTSRKYNSTEV